jgi:hypothetical protein
MDIIEIAKKFSANPSACTDDEIAALAANFDLRYSPIEAALAVGNAHPRGGWDGLLSEIKNIHWQRQNFDALTRNPFATPEEIAAMPKPSDLANLSQSELGAMIFGA